MAIEDFDQVTIAPAKLRPFSKFIMSIGELPTSYLDSLSYAEQVTWFCDYLQNHVIPALNNNATALEEVQNLMTKLQEYVSDYFTNLDVQEEIDNKLDEMVTDGTFTRLINSEILGDINQRILTNTNDISDLEDTTLKSTQTNMITMSMLNQEVRESMTGGSTPVVAANSISNEDIMDNTIDIINLNDNLKNTYIKEYSKIEIPKNLQGFISVYNNAIHINQTSSYLYGVVNLDNNSIYELTTRNYYDMVGLAVTDSKDNLIWSTKPATQDTTGNLFTVTFRTNQSGLKAYISFRDINDYIENYGYLYKYTNLINNNSVNATMLLVEDMTDKYLDKGPHPHPVFESFTGGNIKKYKLSKGTKYSVKSANLYSICGFVITDEKNNTIYESSTSGAGTLTPVSYEFTAANNGYIFISNVPSLNVESSVTIYEDNVIKTGYESKTWLAIGDSLTDPSTLGDNDNYVDYVSDKLKINAVNGGNGGSGYHKRIASNQAFYQLINNSSANPDILTIFGSFNDMYDESGNLINVSAIGNVTDNTTDTICGCINQAINSIITKYPNTLIGIITPTPWQWFNYTNQYELANTYVEKIIEICKLRSIPCLDLFHKSNLRPWDSNFRTQFYLNADGTHPNSLGHKRFSNEIAEFIKAILY